MLYEVEVAVALSRPPGEHRWSKVLVEARDETDAWWTACAMAHRPEVVYVVRTSNPIRATQAGQDDGSEVDSSDVASDQDGAPHSTPPKSP